MRGAGPSRLALLALLALPAPTGTLAVSCGTTRAATPRGEPTPAERLALGDEALHARRYGEARQLYLGATEAADPAVRVQALAQVARIDSIRGEPEKGRPFLERAGKRADPGEPQGWSRYLLVRGVYEREDGHREQAVDTFEQLYDYCLDRGLTERTIDAAHMAAIASDDLADVEAWTRRGLAAAEEAGDEGWQAILWNNLGWAFDDAGRHADALAALTKARALHYRTGDDHAKLVADWSVGHALRLVGRLDEAEDLLRQTHAWAGRRYAAAPDADTAEWVGHCAWELGEVEAARGHSAEAVQWLRAARKRLVEAGIARWWAEGLAELDARVAELSGSPLAE